jgi:hypothetical protein
MPCILINLQVLASQGEFCFTELIKFLFQFLLSFEFCLLAFFYLFYMFHIRKIYGLKSPETCYAIGRNIYNSRVEMCFLDQLGFRLKFIV